MINLSSAEFAQRMFKVNKLLTRQSQLQQRTFCNILLILILFLRENRASNVNAYFSEKKKKINRTSSATMLA